MLNSASSPSSTWYSNDLPAQPARQAPAPTEPDLIKPMQFLSVKNVAKLLDVAPITVYRLVARRELPVYRLARRISFKQSDVLAWVERNRREDRYENPYGTRRR